MSTVFFYLIMTSENVETSCIFSAAFLQNFLNVFKKSFFAILFKEIELREIQGTITKLLISMLMSLHL